MTIRLTLVFLAAALTAAESDEAAVRRAVAAYNDAWNRHDARAMAQSFTADSDTLGVDGSWTRGRAEFEALQTANHRASNRQAVTSRSIQSIRFLRPDVAIVDTAFERTGIRGPDGRELSPRRGLTALVLTKERGRWLIAAYRAMVPTR